MMASPVFCAIDVQDMAKATTLASQLNGHVGGLKLGLEFFTANGGAGYKAIAATGVPIFLDLKLHDIPNTVAKSIAALLPLKPAFMTVHVAGGTTMMKAARETAATAGTHCPKILGVTVLTSLDQSDLLAVGQVSDTKQQVVKLASLAKECGLDGVICSPREVRTLREALGPEFILMVPGIRPSWAKADDQKRTMTPRDAVAAGANYLVIGRPITGAEDPVDAAKRIALELVG